MALRRKAASAPTTPNDVRDFRRRFRGCDPTEVTMALSILKADNERLRAEIEILNGDRPAPDGPDAPAITNGAPKRGASPSVARAAAVTASDSWFARKWSETDDAHLDRAFDRFFRETGEAKPAPAARATRKRSVRAR